MPMAAVEAARCLRNAHDRTRQHFGREAHGLCERAPEIQRKIGVAVIRQPARKSMFFIGQWGFLSRSIDLRSVAGKFHRGVEAAVELCGDFVLLRAQRENLRREHFRVVQGPVAEELDVGIVPTAA
jgi:hypothetical protein